MPSRALLLLVIIFIAPLPPFRHHASGFHAPAGAAAAMRKVRVLLVASAGSFAFSLFKWFYQGNDYGCGFSVFPTFGLAALRWTWNFDSQINCE